MPVVHLEEAGLAYDETGSGPPLVLIPGFASGAWSWAWQVGDLSRDFRVITFDPRGVSRSTLKNWTDVSIELIADDVSDLLYALGSESAHILGISFGGFVAQELAIKFPAKINKLVLASTSFGGPNHILPSPDVLESLAAASTPNSPERIRKYLTMAFSGEFIGTNSSEVERFCDLREQNSLPEEVYRCQLRSAMSFNTEGRIAGIISDTLVISGDRDTVVPFQNSVNLAAKIPNARLAVIENAGHMAFVERAAEFNGLVKDFLLEK